MNRYLATLDTVVGRILIAVGEKGEVTRLSFVEGISPEDLEAQCSRRGDAPVWDFSRCQAAAEEVDEYFRGELRTFTVTVAPAGTSFQREVWSLLQAIPYGETRSYGAIAKAMGNPKAVRAVGRANGANPIAVIIPCHRVIGADGSLTGYAGGMGIKERLLELERPKLPQRGEQNVQLRLELRAS